MDHLPFIGIRYGYENLTLVRFIPKVYLVINLIEVSDSGVRSPKYLKITLTE